MKLYSLLLFSLLSITGGIGNIATVNEHKEQAAEAFKEARYEVALEHYSYLVDTLGETDAGLRLNLGHSYFHTNQHDKAMELYSSLSGHEDAMLRAKANNQLGIIHSQQQKLKEALEFFKSSLRADPSNEGTRYNYELTKKLLEEQEKKEQENQDKKDKEQNEEEQENQQNKDNKQDQGEEQEKKEQEQNEQEQKDQGEQGDPKDEKDGEDPKAGEQKESEEERKERERKEGQQKRMEKINMSEDRAKMLLEAMKNQEKQYYQQLRKKAKAKKENRDKPDW